MSSDARLIGSGQEANVYQYLDRPIVVKMFKSPWNQRFIKWNAAFLRANGFHFSPQLYRVCHAEGWLSMSVLIGFVDLSRYNGLHRQQLVDRVDAFVVALFWARFFLQPAGVEYLDLDNLSNIAVRFGPTAVRVKFYEGGNPGGRHLDQLALTHTFVDKVLRKLRLSRNARALRALRQIKT